MSIKLQLFKFNQISPNNLFFVSYMSIKSHLSFLLISIPFYLLHLLYFCKTGFLLSLVGCYSTILRGLIKDCELINFMNELITQELL